MFDMPKNYVTTQNSMILSCSEGVALLVNENMQVHVYCAQLKPCCDNLNFKKQHQLKYSCQ